VYCLLDCSISLKSKLFMIALNKNGQQSSYILLFFSSGFLIMLKSPPTASGRFSIEHTCASSHKNLSFSSSWAAP
jgi:hypothetical protein